MIIFSHLRLSPPPGIYFLDASGRRSGLLQHFALSLSGEPPGLSLEDGKLSEKGLRRQVELLWSIPRPETRGVTREGDPAAAFRRAFALLSHSSLFSGFSQGPYRIPALPPLRLCACRVRQTRVPCFRVPPETELPLIPCFLSFPRSASFPASWSYRDSGPRHGIRAAHPRLGHSVKVFPDALFRRQKKAEKNSPPGSFFSAMLVPDNSDS